MDKRFLTTTQASKWIAEHYGADVPPHTLRRLAKAGQITTHRSHEHSWYTFSRESLAAYAQSRGFKAVR